MNAYKYATEWLGYVSKSPPQEHGGFDPKTIEGAQVTLREIRRLKRESAKRGHALLELYKARYKRIYNGNCVIYDGKLWSEIRAKLPGLLKEI